MNRMQAKASIRAAMNPSFQIYEVWDNFDQWEPIKIAAFSNNEAAERAIKVLEEISKIDNVRRSLIIEEAEIDNPVVLFKDIDYIMKRRG